MSKQREALQLALEALTEVTGWQWAGPMRVMDEVEDAIAAIREALAEPEQEPVAWMCPHDPERETAFSWRAGMCESSGCGHQRVPLYAAPPARKPLTDEQISAIVQSMSAYTWDAHMLARAIERAHGIGD